MAMGLNYYNVLVAKKKSRMDGMELDHESLVKIIRKKSLENK